MDKKILLLAFIFFIGTILSLYNCYFEYTHIWTVTPFPELFDFLMQIVSFICLGVIISSTSLLLYINKLPNKVKQ